MGSMRTLMTATALWMTVMCVAVGALGVAAARGMWSGSTAVGAIVAATIAGSAFAFASAWFLSRRFMNPMSQLSAILDKAADGDLTGRADPAWASDWGHIAERYNAMVGAIGNDLATIAAEAIELAAASEELTVSSRHISSNAETSSDRAGAMAASASQVSTSIQSVAGATEEMSASIREIASSTTSAATVAA